MNTRSPGTPKHLTPTPAAGQRTPYTDPRVLEREAKNFAELDRLLKARPGRVLLFEEGPLDGHLAGFGTTAKVPAAGLYTVTAACVGASGAKVAVGQEHPGAPFRPMELALVCAGPTSRVIAVQQGYLFAHLLLPRPGDTPWTGAVGGVRVTGPLLPQSIRRCQQGFRLEASAAAAGEQGRDRVSAPPACPSPTRYSARRPSLLRPLMSPQVGHAVVKRAGHERV
jgi:hypothetical protein